MAVDKDGYNAVKQVFLELVLPQLEAIRADIRRLEEKLEVQEKLGIPTLPLGHPTRSRIPPLSDQGQAYLNALCTEVAEWLERTAGEWAERRAKEGSRK